jgi:hypothetical protein
VLSSSRISRLASVAFAAAALLHAAALMWPDLEEPEPAWRHGLFVLINGALAVGVWLRPPWFAPVFVVFAAQQFVSHGASASRIWHEQHRVDWASAITLPFIACLGVWLLRDARRRRSSRETDPPR